MSAAEQKIQGALLSGETELDLSNNQLSALPESLGQLTHLQSLDLSRNQLTVLPESIGQLTKLQTLVLSRNQLTALPESLGQLTKLQSLDLSDNQLTEFPETLSQLTELQLLVLVGNQLTALPESLGQLTQLQSLVLSRNQLSVLPKSIGQLTKLQSMVLIGNQLEELPESLGQLTRLHSLALYRNKLSVLPESIGQLTQLHSLDLSENQLVALPESLGELTQLYSLDFSYNQLKVLPESIGQLTQLQLLVLSCNQLVALPESMSQLMQLESLDISHNRLTSIPSGFNMHANLMQLALDGNPLYPELAAANKEGLAAVKRYLRAKAESQVVLNEAKLILIGEGEVGKSCLLGALRGDPWEEARPTTHGIEIKAVKVNDPATGTEITLNGWDFGGQRVYRPTHQLFFSAPAVYLVVWKPREGPQQGFVKEWIKLVKHREPDAKILVVATHGGPQERQPDIDRQEIWDLFGKESVVDFFFVDSKPPVFDMEKMTWVGERSGIENLREAIARVALSLPEVGRSVPKRWDDTRTALKESGAPYLLLGSVIKLCKAQKMNEEEAKDFIRVAHRLGHLIHYAHDLALRDIVVLKPDWLATAISYVLDDKNTRDNNGLVTFARLGEVWNDTERPAESRYDAGLHPLFLRLMERFDISYKVAVPSEPEDALGFWQRVADSIGSTLKPQAELHYTSLVAQLVPDLRPKKEELDAVWPTNLPEGDAQQVQICHIVEAKTGQSANAEGLFYQLIVRLHRYSLGRMNYRQSVQWQRGLVLDDDYNGRALLEHTGTDVRITVRAAYPETFLAVLTREVKYLVETFWAGLQCDLMVPCLDPCGKDEPGTGLFEVHKLIESKRSKRIEFPCPVCNKWQNIDCLLRNALAARSAPLEELLAQIATVKSDLACARQQLIELRGEALGRFDRLDIGTQRILSRVDDAYTSLMHSLTDEAREGPRLFSFQPVDPGFFDRPSWISQKFRLTLWCEHSRLPLPALNGPGSKAGVYELNLPREWFEKAGPFLKVLTGTLSLVLPVASSATKLMLDDAAYKGLEKEMELGQESLDSVLKGGETSVAWLGRNDATDLERGEAIRAQGAVLRQLHAWLKEKDPSFGGQVRVQNKQQEFLWVHPRFEKEY
jgi:Leucine-rich repeat (LRR) protein